MRITGLQKVTTIDYPGEIACIIFLHGCNFRCGFCYNPDLVIKNIKGKFKKNEILKFLKKRFGKLDAVCITGGEPLMSLDLDFAKKIKKLGYKIKIDTNGSFPNQLRKMIDSGLVDYIAMDIKGESRNYSKISGTVVDLKKIKESIKMIHRFGNYEFRTTIVKRFHNINSMKVLGKWLNEICEGKPKRYFLQGFKRNKNGMIDSSFLQEENVDEKFLKKLKKDMEEFSEEVGIRV